MEKYSFENLNPSDRDIYDTLEQLCGEVLSEEQLKAYLDANVNGQATKAIYADILNPFLEFLKEQAEYFKVDMIIGCIESYENEKEN